ncbi:hypothetical protein CVT24_003015 [Panaeolus cyanescens]|uniref:SHSP domain-containing protein n=1 Tax=Panaeolus cyanescens TaxID=181874 RepID=A0A409VFT9_9AGAR|nr:hypothetical protein CVT24_003015 [Panaeolus cyanescens]
MSEFTNFDHYGQMDLDTYQVGEGAGVSNHPTPAATGSNPPTPQHTEGFETAIPGSYPSIGADIAHWETIQHLQGHYQHQQEYHSHHTSPMPSTTPTPIAFHSLPMPHDVTLEPPAHTVPSQIRHHHSTTTQTGYAQVTYQGQSSPKFDDSPILLLPPDAVQQQAPRHRVLSGEMSRTSSSTPTSSSVLLEPERSSPAPVASSSRSKSKAEASAQGGAVRNTRSTRARSQLASSTPYHPRPAPGAPAGRLGGIMGGTQPAAPTAPTGRQTRQASVRYAAASSTSIERKVSGGSAGMPSPSEFRVPGSAAGSPLAHSPTQPSNPLPTPSIPPAAPAPAQGMGGGMFTFHSKNKVTASSSSPSPFTVTARPAATSSKSKAKSASRTSAAPLPPPVITEFEEVDDPLPTIEEGKESEHAAQPSTSTTTVREPLRQSSSRRSVGPSTESAVVQESPRFHPYAHNLRALKMKAFQSANIPSYAPRTDIHYDEEKQTMIASMEMPGVKRDNIHITLGTSKFNHVKFVHILACSLPVFPSVQSRTSGEASAEAPVEAKTEPSATDATSTEPSTAPKLSSNMALVHAGFISPDVRERKFGILKRAFPVPGFTKVSRQNPSRYSPASLLSICVLPLDFLGTYVPRILRPSSFAFLPTFVP